MSDATYYFDVAQHRETGNPDVPLASFKAGEATDVINWFEGGTEQTYTSISGYYQKKTQNLKHIELLAPHGLFVRGTTSEIVEALQNEINNGLERFACVSSREIRMDIRYLRQQVPRSLGRHATVTILGLGSRDYWGLGHPAAKDCRQAEQGKSWVGLENRQGHPAVGVYSKPFYSAISVSGLIAHAKACQGVSAWV